MEIHHYTDPTPESLTATSRNWLIGCYIVEYEQEGRDRAKYGDRLLKRLEESVNTKGLNLTLFKNSRRFYLLYPQIGVLVGKSPTPSDFLATGQSNNKKSPTPSGEFAESSCLPIHPTASDEFITSPQNLLSKLSFSHITEIMTQDNRWPVSSTRLSASRTHGQSKNCVARLPPISI